MNTEQLLRDSLQEIANWPDGGNRYGQEKIKAFASQVLATTPPASQEQAQQPSGGDVAWRDYVEQRLHSWRHSRMNQDGDRAALADYLNDEAISDLIDYVCSEYEGPIVTPKPEPMTDEQMANCINADKFARSIIAARDAQWQSTRLRGSVPEGHAPYSINEIEAWADDADKHGLKFVPVSSATLRLIVGGLRATRCGVPNCWKGFEK